MEERRRRPCREATPRRRGRRELECRGTMSIGKNDRVRRMPEEEIPKENKRRLTRNERRRDPGRRLQRKQQKKRTRGEERMR